LALIIWDEKWPLTEQYKYATPVATGKLTSADCGNDSIAAQQTVQLWAFGIK